MTPDTIDRRPITLIICTAGVHDGRPPEFDPWGYTNKYRAGGAAGILAAFDAALAAGLPARFLIGKPIGTAFGQDVTAYTEAMHPAMLMQWGELLAPWIAERSAEYPDITIGPYTGSGFFRPGQAPLDCPSSNPRPAHDTDTQAKQDLFRKCHGFWFERGCTMLGLDKSAIPDRIEATIRTADRAAAADAFTGQPVKIIAEPIDPGAADRLAMMARTHFMYARGLEDATFDPQTTEIHWMLQNDANVPDFGAPLREYVQAIADRGVIPMCVWPFAAAEIVEVAQSHPWLRNN